MTLSTTRIAKVLLFGTRSFLCHLNPQMDSLELVLLHLHNRQLCRLLLSECLHRSKGYQESKVPDHPDIVDRAIITEEVLEVSLSNSLTKASNIY